MKKMLLIQPCGIGDVVFLQKLCSHFVGLGYEIDFPLKSNLMYMKDYVKTPGVKFLVEGIYNQDNYDFVYDAQKYVMKKKYETLDMQWGDWKEYFSINRNYEREHKLELEYGIDGEDFCLVNRRFGTPPNFLTKSFPVNSNLKIIETDINLDFKKGFNVFDWCGVLERAKEIYTVDTCFCYFVEVLDINATTLNLYARNNNIVNVIDGIYKKDWNWNG